MSSFSICGETLFPGQKKSVCLSVPMDGLSHGGRLDRAEGAGNDDYLIPATLICGKEEGPTLLISAGIHSGEYVGISAVIRTAREIDAEKLSGNLILLHCVNLSGILSHRYRFVPEDGFNLNAGYPGRADGSVGERIAAWFVRELFPHVDFIFDLHGGSAEELMVPLVFFPHAKKVRDVSLAAAKALNIGFFLESYAETGMYSYAANTFGIPGILLERGNGVLCTEEEFLAEQNDLRLLLNHLGMLPAGPDLYDAALPRRVFRETFFLESDLQGLWYPAVKNGDVVKKGDFLGVTEDYFGNILSEYRAEADGIVLYFTRGLAVSPGDALVTYAKLGAEET